MSNQKYAQLASSAHQAVKKQQSGCQTRLAAFEKPAHIRLHMSFEKDAQRHMAPLGAVFQQSAHPKMDLRTLRPGVSF